MHILEVYVFGLPLMCRRCGGLFDKVDRNGMCRECKNALLREQRKRQRERAAKRE